MRVQSQVSLLSEYILYIQTNVTWIEDLFVEAKMYKVSGENVILLCLEYRILHYQNRLKNFQYIKKLGPVSFDFFKLSVTYCNFT